jgi:hypothetical protein
MISQAQILKLLTEHILNAGTQWSLGTFGAIAEFSRDPDEPVKLTTSEEEIAAVTKRGGVAIRMVEGLRPFASESITRLNWNHRVALCLTKSACAMSQRAVLTELGPDTGALRAEDRGNILFDLGLDALQADLCIRLADAAVVANLRAHVGRSVFEPGNPAMAIILSASPHRVFISRVGRIEVYQSIPPAMGKSPDGPHTHVLPKLLKSRRTHPATEPIPDDWIPCAHFYPPHPAKDAMGHPRSFDQAQHDAFQKLLGVFGSPISVVLKNQIVAAITDEQSPSAPEVAADRVTRISIRVALRQMKASGQLSRSLPAWFEAFDRLGPEIDEDEAPEQHEH